jgi:hypothetical protein
VKRLKIGIFASIKKSVFEPIITLFNNTTKFLISSTDTTLFSYDGETIDDENFIITNDLEQDGQNIYAAGNNGLLLKSTDSITWEKINNPIEDNLNYIKYYGDKYFLVGDSDKLVYSTNTISWTSLTINRSSNQRFFLAENSFLNNIKFKQIAYKENSEDPTNNQTIVVGDNNLLLSSDSNVNNTGEFDLFFNTTTFFWTTQQSNLGSVAIADAFYGNGLLAAVGSNQLRTSTDGINWTTVTSGFGTTAILTVGYGNNRWIIAGNSGQMRISTDASNWTTVTSRFGTTYIFRVRYVKDQWLAVGNHRQIRSSTDAVNWSTVTTTRASNQDWKNLDESDEHIVVVGSSGGIIRSTDGITWQTATSNSTANFRALEWGDGTWAAAGFGGLRTSTDGLTWNTQTQPPGTNLTMSYLDYQNGLWSMVSDTTEASNSGRFHTSTTSATSWVQRLVLANKPNTIAYHPEQGSLYLFGNGGMIINSFYNTLNIPNNITDYKNNFIGQRNNKRTFTSSNGITWTMLSDYNIVQTVGNVSYGSVINDFTVFQENWIAGGGPFGGQAHSSTDGLSWFQVRQNQNEIRKYAQNEDIVIAAGTSGTVRTSTDLINWNVTTSNFGSTQIVGATFGNGTFVIGGFNGRMRISTDTVVWTTVTSGFGTSVVRTVIYENEIFVSAGNGGKVGYSTDATNWTVVVPTATSTILFDSAYGNGMFAIVGSLSRVLYSSNGINWTAGSTGMGVTHTNISYIDGMFITDVTSGIAWSTNLVNWTSVQTSHSAIIKKIEDRYYARVGISNIGIVESPQKYNLKLDNGVYKDNNNTVILSDSGILNLESSENNFDTIQTNIDDNFVKMAYDGESYILQGENALYKKNDLDFFDTAYPNLRFSSVTSPFPFTSPNTITDLVYKNELWFAVNQSGTIGTSTNAINWTSSTVGGVLRGVTYGNDTWVVVGNGGLILTSTDTVSWTTETSNMGTTILHTAEYANGIFVVGGNNGTIRYSTDAVSWNTATSGFGTSQILKINFLNNLFVAVGSSGKASTSTDGITWTTIDATFGTNSILFSHYGNNIYLLGGNNGQIRSSTDLVTWSTITHNFGTSGITAGFYAEDKWVVGSNSTLQPGTARQSTDLITWNTISTNQTGIGTSRNEVSQINYTSGTWVLGGGNSKIGVATQQELLVKNTSKTFWTTISKPENLTIENITDIINIP